MTQPCKPIFRATAAIVLAAIASAATAQSYPNKTVRIIVPFSPGGASDALPRLLGARLSELWGQQIIIDNRPGAAGNIGMEMGAKAPPDGYTLTSGPIGNLAVNPHMYKLSYDIFKDFTPITMMSRKRARRASFHSLPVREGAHRAAQITAWRAQLRLGWCRHTGTHGGRAFQSDDRNQHGARAL